MMQSKMPFSVRSSSAAVMGSNEDLLIDILILIPAKALIEFQLVSKKWHSVISSPSFRHLHTLHHHRRPKPQTYFLLRSAFLSFICNPTIKRLLVLSNFHSVHVLQSCNGLLLLECPSKCFYVFNPTTMQTRDLQPPKASIGLCLVFDPSKSSHYKVFCFRSLVHTVSVSVYESETHTWKDRPAELECGKLRNGIYWKGSIFFINSCGKSRRFSLEDEQFYMLPKSLSKKHNIIETNGYMHSVLLSLSGKNVEVYELSDVDFGWSRKYFADLKLVWDTFGAENGNGISLLGMVREERLEDSILVVHVPDKIMVLRLLTKTFEVLVDFSKDNFEGQNQFDFWKTHQFIESLVPV